MGSISAGGLAFQPEVVALIIGLGLNSPPFIAEIIRGIIAISHGQTEAALALGLKPRWNLEAGGDPQALRIIIPPMVSQYLNVVKNSTLAGFIGYPDLFSVIGTSQNQTGRAVECVTILMLFYLSVSLIISTVIITGTTSASRWWSDRCRDRNRNRDHRTGRRGRNAGPTCRHRSPRTGVIGWLRHNLFSKPGPTPA